MMTFLKAKFGHGVEKAMRWAVRQKKHIVETAVDTERHISTDDVFGEFAEEGDKIENLQMVTRHMY
eukprot:4777340-Prorocentrum_lima.AAC.1